MTITAWKCTLLLINGAFTVPDTETDTDTDTDEMDTEPKTNLWWYLSVSVSGSVKGPLDPDNANKCDGSQC